MFAQLFSFLFEEAAARGGIPWWVWLIIIIILLVFLWFWFGREDEAAGEAAAEVATEPEVEVAAEEAGAEAEAEVAPEPEPEAEPAVEAEPSDFKKIEGIGPKVASLLNGAGIATFAQLAETPVEKLEGLLKENKLQMMKPDSWPEQAKLAAAGEWEALQKLQDELQGGR